MYLRMKKERKNMWVNKLGKKYTMNGKIVA